VITGGFRRPFTKMDDQVPLRSLHLISTDARRGAETFALRLCEALVAQGHQARVVALSPSSDEHRHDVEPLGPRRRAYRTLAALRRAAADVDVVVAHGSSTLEACAVALTRTGVPFVFRTIGDPAYWTPRGSRRALGVLLRRARLHVTLWEAAASYLAQVHRIDPNSIDVIPNAVDGALFPPATDEERSESRRRFLIAPGQPCLAYVGALSAEKDVGGLLTALRDLPGAVLLVAGEGPEAPHLRRLADQHARGRVRFLGGVPEPGAVYAAADLLVLPSRSEGMPAVVIEAGLRGTASVATRVGAVPEMIADGVNGVLARPGDPEALAVAIRRGLADPRALGRSAAAAYRRAYTMSAVVHRWEKVLHEAAGQSTSGPHRPSSASPCGEADS
jgi:glycosyltransferase involved in cell wall biosynthesis